MGRGDVFVQQKYPIEWCAIQWCRTLQVVDQYKYKLKNFMEITYEDLTADPDDTVARICAFTGAEAFPGVLRSTAFEVHRHKEQIVNMNERSIRALTHAQLSAINSVAGDYLKQYGYFMSRP
jgi:hypothetical protein